ncbi:MAG: hypothetical protein IJ298_09015 [Ruminococcus sp.]|nr:hypothetical protein [Ruminococcus sp.]
MLIKEPTSEMIAEWKRIFEEYHSTLTPNRKSGYEVDSYFREKYSYQLFDNAEFQQMVSLNITENDFLRSKLPKGVLPNIQSYQIGEAFVAIDLCTGEFHVESENIEEVIPIFDDLFVYRGLDEDDLKNYFLVAEYVKLSKK